MCKKAALSLVVICLTSGVVLSMAGPIVHITVAKKIKIAERMKVVYKLPRTPNFSSIKPLAVTKAGDSAEGVVVLEEAGELYLDTSPCISDVKKKQVYTFYEPYDKGSPKEKTCEGSGMKYKSVAITQRDGR